MTSLKAIKGLPINYEINPLQAKDLEDLKPIFHEFNSNKDKDTGKLILDKEDYDRDNNLGLHLINRLKEQVESEGYTEMIWVSGPRYKQAWKFYTRNFGKAIANLDRYFNDRWPGMVWRVEL